MNFLPSRRRLRRGAVFLAALCAGGMADGTLFGAELRVGSAAVNITPKIGTPMAGYYFERGAEGVHDPLQAKVIVLEAGGTKAALVALDLISTLRTTVEAARKRIEAETGIPGANVMISATHSHTGPTLAGTRRFDALGGTNDLAREYNQALPALIAEGVRAAAGKLEPAQAAYGAGEEPGLAFNRRFHMRDGTVGWNPGKLNPNIVRVAGPVDAEAQVVSFTGNGRQPRAAYVNFPMHLDTVGGTHFSADYPFMLSELLAQAKGPELLTLFTIGCAGDINHINVHWGDPQKGHGEAARIGTILAARVLRVMERMNTNITPGILRASQEMVALPLPKITPEEIAAAEAIVERVNAKTQPEPKFMEQVQAFKALDVRERAGRAQEAEVQVIALSKELAWVSLPGEIFVELGLSIKAGSPFKQTMIAELANGSIGYIPSRRAYAEGNYEVVSARCAEGSGEMLVESALRQLKKLYAE